MLANNLVNLNSQKSTATKLMKKNLSLFAKRFIPNWQLQQDIDLEKDIFKAICIFFTCELFFYAIYDWIVFADALVTSLNIAALLLFFFFYYVLLIRKHFKKYIRVFAYFLFFFLILDFFINSGFYGTSVYIFFIIHAFTFIIIFDKKDRKTFLIIEAIIISCLLYIHFFKAEWIHINLKIPEYHYAIRVVADLALFIYMAYIVKTNHEAKQKYILEQNDILVSQYHEILTQNEEISQQREELQSINNTLDELVQNRTRHIESQNQQLLEYAFFNAHKVRGPLARILGLSQLIESSENEQDLIYMIQKIKENAYEMDIVIAEINALLNKNR